MGGEGRGRYFSGGGGLRAALGTAQETAAAGAALGAIGGCGVAIV